MLSIFVEASCNRYVRDDLIDKPDMVKEISSAAIDRYKYLLSDQGKDEFCLRCKTLLMDN